MDVLVDTNILLRSADPAHPWHDDAVNATNARLLLRRRLQ